MYDAIDGVSIRASIRVWIMVTDKEHVDLIIDQLRDGRVVFNHSPERWSQCNLPVELQWVAVPFSEDNRDAIPSNKFGVYAFMLKPDFTGPPESSYLLYIGKTEDTRRFRRRYSDYLYYQRTGNRPVISRMLKRWDGHIWFYYATVEDVRLVDEIETTLLNACIPPYNNRFKGQVGRGIMAFRQEIGG